MQGYDIIQRLEGILAESQTMLAAATEGRWDDLIELEVARRASVLEIAATQAAIPDAALQERKKNLVRDILAADAQTKTLTEAWMSEIQSVLTSVQAERKLIRAYESV